MRIICYNYTFEWCFLRKNALNIYKKGVIYKKSLTDVTYLHKIDSIRIAPKKPS